MELVGELPRQVDVLPAVLAALANIRSLVELVPCLDVDQPRAALGVFHEQPLPGPPIKPAILPLADQRRTARYSRVVVSRPQPCRVEELRGEGSAPLVLAVGLARPAEHLHEEQVGAEVAAEHRSDRGEEMLVHPGGEGRGVEEHQRLPVDLRPVLGWDLAPEVPDRAVEPEPAGRRRKVDVVAAPVVLQGARVVEHADSRRLLPFAKESLSGSHQLWQPLVAP